MVDETKEQIRVCHFSDLHLPLSDRIRLNRLVGKRCLGYVNLRFLRGQKYKLAPFVTMLQEIAREQVDLVIMTGDLTSLALDMEFEQAGRILLDAGLQPEKTIIVPGNHDRYTFGADLSCAFEKGMERWLSPGFVRAQDYPIIQKVGPVVVAALDTAVWRNPIRSAGYIGPDQIERLVSALDRDELRGCWPVIAMHHPPFRLRQARLRDFKDGLDGLEALLRALDHRRATILHGHLHRLSRRHKAGLEVIGVPSASHDAGNESGQMAYHIYTFGRGGLLHAEAVRHWPSGTNDKPLFERMELPEEAFAD